MRIERYTIDVAVSGQYTREEAADAILARLLEEPACMAVEFAGDAVAAPAPAAQEEKQKRKYKKRATSWRDVGRNACGEKVARKENEDGTVTEVRT